MRSSSGVQRVARELRCTSTAAERLLWTRLRGRALLGFKFRRQHAIDRFVLDFYCAEARLALELDGAQHQEPDALHYDRIRTEQLALVQLRVPRFRNQDVLQDIDRACDDIRKALLLPLPPCGRGPG